MQTLTRTRSFKPKFSKSTAEKGLSVECPSCKAVITLKNTHSLLNRFCWRCLQDINLSFSNN